MHSQLIGELVEARVKADTIEVWYGDRKMEELARLRGRGKHRVDYRRIIDWVVRKPGAFENYRYCEELFPTSWFRMSYDVLREQWGPRRGAKEYVQILALAARRGESGVEQVLRALLKDSPERLSAAAVIAMLDDGAPCAPITAVEVDRFRSQSSMNCSQPRRPRHEYVDRGCEDSADRGADGPASADRAALL